METLTIEHYKNFVLHNPFIGYAYHRIITDSEGNPIDYEYIEANEQFEKYTGLNHKKIIGKRVTELIPGIDKDNFKWIDFFGDVAITGKSKVIEQYSDKLHKWYSISASCPEKGYFVAVFYDITNIKNSESNLKSINEEYAALNEEYLAQNEELQSMLEEIQEKKDHIEKVNIQLKNREDQLIYKDILQKSILNSTSSAILAVNKNGRVIFANDKFYKYWNIPDELIDSNDENSLLDFAILQLKDPQEFLQKVKQLYNSKEISNDVIKFKDKRVFERYSEPIIENKKVVGRIWSFNDITKEENQKIRLEKINNILNSIREINKLQVQETNLQKFINGVCNILVGGFSLDAAMINLYKQNKFIAGAQSGYDENYSDFVHSLKNGQLPKCFAKSVKEDIYIVENRKKVCDDCIINKNVKVLPTCVIPIKSEGAFFGFLNIRVAPELAEDSEFLNLFKEIAGEIGLVLRKMDLEQEQKKNLQEIRQRENKLNSILQSSPIGIGYKKNRMLYSVNDKFCEMTGYSRAELIGEYVKKLYAKKDEYLKVGHIISNLSNYDKPRSIEVKWIKKDGSLMDVELNIALVNPLNAAEGFSFTVENITDRKKHKLIRDILLNLANESTKTEDIKQLAPIIQTELNRLFDTENFYIAIYNHEKEMYQLPYHRDKFDTDYNNAGDTYFDLTGSLTDLVRKEKRAYLIDSEIERKLVEEGKLGETIGEDSPIWMGAPLINTNGYSFGIIGVQHYENKNAYTSDDLNILDYIAKSLSKLIEKKQAENALKTSEENYRMLINNQGEGVARVDLNEDIVFINYAGAEIFGMDSEELIGRNLSEFMSADHFARVREETAKRTKGEKSTYELVINNKKGGIRNILLTATPIMENGKVVGNLGIFRDITDYKKTELYIKLKNEELQATEEELKAANDELHWVNIELEKNNRDLLLAMQKAESADRLKSAFLANMSHEIRTPMNSILGFSELLKNENITKEKQRRFIDIINTNGKQLITIIDDIIDFSKIEANQIELHNTNVDLIKLLDDLYFTYKNQCRYEELPIKIDLMKPQLKEFIIQVDESRLNQIFNNLIGNAIKFTKEGSVKFGCELKNEDQLLCFVKDTGIGIPKDKQDVIFERFRQADDSSSREFGGTGLGLTITKSLIGLMGGEIWVESEMEKGSCFYFTLPLLIGK